MGERGRARPPDFLKLHVRTAETSLMRRFALVMLAAVAAVSGWAEAAAAYPLQFVVVTVSDSDLDPGQALDVTLTGCDVGAIVDFRLESSTATAVCATTTGGASLAEQTTPGMAVAELTAPELPGRYDGVVSFATDDGDVQASFSVVVDVPEIRSTSIVGASSGGPSDYVTIATFSLFGLLFVLSCSVAFWYLFLRRRAAA
jgi:hypothetical protein